MVIIDGYQIDAAITEEHTFDSEVTAHPVEQGADVTDHVRARPIVVGIEGVVSDTPIGLLAGQRGSDVKPSDDAFARLLAIREAREPVTIETSLRVFERMILTSLSVPRSSSTGDALRFRATFQQIELVTNERTTIRVEVPRAAKKVNRGNKPAQEVSADSVPAASSSKASILKATLSGKRPAILDELGL